MSGSATIYRARRVVTVDPALPIADAVGGSGTVPPAGSSVGRSGDGHGTATIDVGSRREIRERPDLPHDAATDTLVTVTSATG